MLFKVQNGRTYLKIMTIVTITRLVSNIIRTKGWPGKVYTTYNTFARSTYTYGTQT